MENIMLAHMKIFSLSLQFLNTISVVYDKKKKINLYIQHVYIGSIILDMLRHPSDILSFRQHCWLLAMVVIIFRYK